MFTVNKKYVHHKPIIQIYNKNQINKLHIGTMRDLVITNSKASGLGPEPDDRIIDTGMRSTDFAVGEKVMVWWWGKWWDATIQYIAKTKNTVSVRWNFDNKVTANYKAKLVKKKK